LIRRVLALPPRIYLGVPPVLILEIKNKPSGVRNAESCAFRFAGGGTEENEFFPLLDNASLDGKSS
jgi:hypothetical protein